MKTIIVKHIFDNEISYFLISYKKCISKGNLNILKLILKIKLNKDVRLGFSGIKQQINKKI